ncbi:MAG: amino acid ABC transporter substrate-binding protein [Clostridia bacterium]|nr:amino acid ABC transporter substrate-binding protein [Clostridia bacterium]
MKYKMLFLWFFALLLCFSVSASAEEAEEIYMENEWNFVENSMDVTNGIPEDAAGALERIRLRGKLLVAMEPYFPPQEFIDPSKTGQERYVGADVELAKLIAQRMGVELEIVPMEFSRVLFAVADGECDLAVSALAYTPSRAVMTTLSKGYYYSGTTVSSGILIRKADRDEIKSIDDLSGRVIVAQSGSLQESQTAEHVLAYKEFRRLSTMQQVYGAVREGVADAATVDIETALAYIQNHPSCGLTLAEGIQFDLEEQFEGDRIAGRKGELQLIYFVNGVIDEVLSSGQYQAWYNEYEQLAALLAAEKY